MKCTECNKVLKPVVAIDIDGTLGDFHGHFWDFMRSYLGVECPDPTPIYDGSISFKGWAMEHYLISDSEWADIKLAYRQGGMKRSMPIKPGASALVYELREYGAEIWITTTRPYLRLDNIDPDTRAWLERNRIPYDGLLYDEEKYAKLFQYIGGERVVAVLDDLMEECYNAEMYFGPDVPIMMRNPYNLATKFAHMSSDLLEVQSVIKRRIDEWNRVYGEEELQEGPHVGR
jgi:hypothetical protein